MFGGYERYVGLKLSQTYEAHPVTAAAPHRSRRRSAPGAEERSQRHQSPETVRAFGRRDSGAPLSPVHHRRRRLAEVIVVCRPPVGGVAERSRMARFEAGPDATILGQALYNDICTYLPDDILALSDRLSMLQGLELPKGFPSSITRWSSSARLSRTSSKSEILRRNISYAASPPHIFRADFDPQETGVRVADGRSGCATSCADI